MIEIGAYDIDDHAEITVEQYEALMQDCEENGIEVVDCDLDAFYSGGFMTNADDKEVTMNLSADTVNYTGKAVTPPAVTLTSDMGAEYAEDEDYTLTYYQIVGLNGDTAEAEIAKENIIDEGVYRVVATPTRSGVLFGEAWAEFSVVKSDTVILGDADGDGKVTVLDATTIQKVKASIDVPYFSEDAADVDTDGSVSVLDATWIQKHLASLPSPSGIGKPMRNYHDRIDLTDSALIGSWAYEEDENFVYTFNADGKGTYDAYGDILNFDYVDYGSFVTISYSDAPYPADYDYTISGNTLTIQDSGGNDVNYIKK